MASYIDNSPTSTSDSITRDTIDTNHSVIPSQHGSIAEQSRAALHKLR